MHIRELELAMDETNHAQEESAELREAHRRRVVVHRALQRMWSKMAASGFWAWHAHAPGVVNAGGPPQNTGVFPNNTNNTRI